MLKPFISVKIKDAHIAAVSFLQQEKVVHVIDMEIVSCFLLISGIIATLFVGIYSFFNVAFLYWKKKGVPSLEPSFPFGNLADILTRKKSMGEAYADVYKEMDGKKFGGAYFMHRPKLIIRDPEMIRNFLVKDFEFFHDHGFVFGEEIDPLSGNVFMLTGKKWKDLRTDLSPTFTSGKMKNMFKALEECGCGLKEFLMEPANNEDIIEVKDIMAKFTSDVIASCAFGIQCNCLKNPDAEFRRWGKRILELSLFDNFVGMLYLLVPSVPISLKLPLTPRSVAAFFRNLVKETVEFREKNEVKRNDFMQLLIDLKEHKGQHGAETRSLTMDEITAQVLMFFTAGFETSSTTMSFCLFELATNLGIQERLRNEIDSALQEHNGNVTYDAIKEMKYLDKVVSETLRKYPPVTFLNRDCNKDYNIRGTDIVVEKGVQVVIPVLGLHRDAEYYPDPETFDPERFGEEVKNKRSNYVYLPFGEGPRICIGMRFALMQIKVGLVCMLSNYEFRTCVKTSLPLTIDPKQFIMTPDGGVWLRISNRTKNRG